MLRKVHVLTVLAALALLACSAAQAMPLESPAGASEGVLTRIWDWVASLFQGEPTPNEDPKAAWSPDGSHLDPHGGDD